MRNRLLLSLVMQLVDTEVSDVVVAEATSYSTTLGFVAENNFMKY